MWFIIAKKEIRLARRNYLFLVLTLITWLLLAVAGAGIYYALQYHFSVG